MAVVLERSAQVLLEEARHGCTDASTKHMRNTLVEILTRVRRGKFGGGDGSDGKLREEVNGEKRREKNRRQKHAGGGGGGVRRGDADEEDAGHAGEIEQDVRELIDCLREPEKRMHGDSPASFMRREHQKIEDAVRQEEAGRRRRRRRRQHHHHEEDEDEDEDEDEHCDAIVSLIGSASLDIITEPNRQMSIAVCMPAALFYEKDYLNNRYYLKRLCFIRWMASKLVRARQEAHKHATQAASCDKKPRSSADHRKRQRDEDGDNDDETRSNAALELVSIVDGLSLGFFGNGVDMRKPVLDLRVTDGRDSSWQIRVLPYPPRKAFAHAVHRLHHNFHNGMPALDSVSAGVRRGNGGGNILHNLDRQEMTKNCNIRGTAGGKQTYAYNNGILEDITILDNLATLRKSIAAWKHGADAMVILRVWARNKGLIAKSSSSSGAGSGLFTPFALRCIACHALNRKRKELAAQTEHVGGDSDDDDDGVRKSVPVPPLYAIDALATFRLMLSGIVEVCRHIVQCRKLVDDPAANVAANGAAQNFVTRGSVDNTKTSAAPVLLDDNRLTNLLAHVGFAALTELALHARKTHALLGSHRAATAPTLNTVSAFYNAIMYREQWPSADLVIHVHVSSSSPRTGPTSNECFARDMDFWREQEERIADVLRRGLKSRIISLRTSRVAPRSPMLSSMATVHGNGDDTRVDTCLTMTIVVCIAYNPSTCNSLIDLGPAANNEGLQQQFRGLWGSDRTTLRRFRDGSVREAVVWDRQDVGAAYKVTAMAATHLLKRHLPAAQLSVFSTQLDDLIPVGAVPATSNAPQGAEGADVRTQSIADAYGALKSGLQSLPDLPLKIMAITKLSDTLLATSTLIPAPSDAVLAMSGASLGRRADDTNTRQPVDMVVRPHEVALEFEFSGKWPQREALPGDVSSTDELYDDEVLSIKSSMLVLIGKSLQETYGYFSIAEDDLLDVFVGGYVFRLRIHHRRPRNPSELISQAMITEMNEEEERARQLHAKLVEAMTSREQNFAVVCRLCKRWIGAHMFSLALSNEDVELIVAYLFSNKRSVRAPQTPIHGLQCFLRLLCDHDWSNEPLVVDINSDILDGTRNIGAGSNGNGMHENGSDDVKPIDTSSVMADVRRYMQNHSKRSVCEPDANGTQTQRAGSGRRRAMVILTPYECMSGKLVPDENSFSRTPDETDTALLVKTASASLAHIEKLLEPVLASGGETDNAIQQRKRWLQLFAVNTKRFDIVFSVDRKFATYSMKRIQKRAAVNDDGGRKSLLCGFEPVLSFISSAKRRVLGARLYYDATGGDKIGVVLDSRSADSLQHVVFDLLDLGEGLISHKPP